MSSHLDSTHSLIQSTLIKYHTLILLDTIVVKNHGRVESRVRSLDREHALRLE
jgi:hypothetical protein